MVFMYPSPGGMKGGVGEKILEIAAGNAPRGEDSLQLQQDKEKESTGSSPMIPRVVPMGGIADKW